MTEQEYNAINAVRRSELHQLKKSPAHYKWSIDHPQEDTPALKMGRAVHAAVLEPDEFMKRYIVAPKVDRRTKQGKLEYEAFVSDHGQCEILTDEEYQMCIDIREAINNHSLAKELLSGPHETTHVWQDETTGMMCKIRTDAESYAGGKHWIIDLKTTTDASQDSFMREAQRYEYDLQAAMYCEGVKAETGDQCDFVFIAVEKNPPYMVNVTTASESFKLHGYDIFRERMGILKECTETGNWYGYNGFTGFMNDLTLPNYLEKEYATDE